MNLTRAQRAVVLILISTLGFGQAPLHRKAKISSQPTLLSLRQKYIGRTVVAQNVEGSWKGGSIHEGSTGKVVSITLNEEHIAKKYAHPNAFGETQDGENETINPYVDVTIRLADNTTSYTTGYAHNFCCERDQFQVKYLPFRVTTPKELHAKVIRNSLPSIIGKHLYALRDSELFLPNTTRENLIAHRGPQLSESDKRWMGYLHRLQIVNTEYDEESDSILFKLVLPNGKSALAVSSYVEEGPKAPFLQKIEGSLFASVPHYFSPLDMRSLQSGVLVPGVKEEVVYQLYGRPENENNWGRGGTQLVYNSGRVFVYLDRSGRVVDTQHHDF